MHAVRSEHLSETGVRIGISPRACFSAVALIVSVFVVLLASATSARADYSVNACGVNNPNDVFTPTIPADFSVTPLVNCGTPAFSSPVIGFSLFGTGNVVPVGQPATPQGTRGAYEARAPTDLEIVGASTPQETQTLLNGAAGGWGASVYWQNGSAALALGPASGTWSGFASPVFGFQIVCIASACPNPVSGGLTLVVTSMSLKVHETVKPTLTATGGLWQANGWLRGQWPLGFSSDSPSGVCALTGSLNQIEITQTSGGPPNVATWHQCSAPPVSATVNTGLYGQGRLPLVITATDAAGNVGQASRTVDVDNSVPTVSFSGPTEASSTAGPQLVTATAGGSPSGIDEIVCSVDGGPVHAYPGAVAQVPVSGVGEHQVSCTATNNAVDPNGVHGVSQAQTRRIKIAVPTALDVTFARVAGLRCKLEKRQRNRVDVTRCHLERRKRARHKSVAPHLKAEAEHRVGHGRATAVSGWLGLADGSPLGGRTVEVLTAPDNGTGRFTAAAEVITAANGTWSVSLPAGPSRLIEASYAGSATTLPSQSAQATLLVPSKVELNSVTPGHVAWGQTVTIKGRLLDGYLPHGGINVRLRIGIANADTTFGVKEHVGGSGNFTATFTFGPGDPLIRRTYWFQIASLPAGDYPYTPSASNRIYVQVGGP